MILSASWLGRDFQSNRLKLDPAVFAVGIRLRGFTASSAWQAERRSIE